MKRNRVIISAVVVLAILGLLNVVDSIYAGISVNAEGLTASATINSSSTISLSSSAVNLNITPSTSGTLGKSSALTVSTYTNSDYDCAVTMTMTPVTVGNEDKYALTNTTGGNTYLLDSLTSGTTYTDATFENDAWGYQIGSGSYNPIVASNPITTVSTNTGSTAATTNVYFAAKLTPATKPGTYSGTVTFASTCTPPPITIADLAYLQDFGLLSSGDMTSVLGSMTEGQSYELEDKRDGKTYNVAKLADGKVWLQDNLSLDLATLTQAQLYGIGDDAGKLTNASNTTLGYLKNGGGTTSDQWATAAVSKNWTSSYSYSAPLIAVDSTTSGICNDPTTWCVDSSGNGAWSWDTVIPATINNKTSYAQGKLGVYYNYCAASAGSYCWGNGTSYGGTPGSDPNSGSLHDVTEDICPYGWRMPTSTNAGDYKALYDQYSGASPSQANAFQVALSTPLSGLFNLVGKAYYQGNYGHFWSSTWYGADREVMYYLSVSSTSANLSDNDLRTLGYSVRCLVDN